MSVEQIFSNVQFLNFVKTCLASLAIECMCCVSYNWLLSCISACCNNEHVSLPLVVVSQEESLKNPCFPSPCGLYSVCHVVSDHPVCSCQAGHVGSPPACRPECIVSTECPQEKACINQKCLDPCPATCGLNASCQVVNHSPIRTCSVGFIGDPFVRCIKEESKHCLSSVFNFVNICLPNVSALSWIPSLESKVETCLFHLAFLFWGLAVK